MADLDSLIRFRKYGVDEKQRLLAQLYREAEELTQKKKALETQIAKETALAEEMGSVETLSYLGLYLEGARTKIKAIEAAIGKMDLRIALAQEDMRAAFAEMKKVEITQDRREEREEEEIQKKESRELDDIAIDLYRRNLEDGE